MADYTEPTTVYQPDEVDMDIIRALQGNGRLSVRELAAKIHRSPTPTFERLRRLEQAGIIRGYTVRIETEMLGRNFTVFCNVRLSRINTEIHTDFAKAINAMDEVTECYNVSGSFDYMLKVSVSDMRGYRAFVTDKLGRLSIVDSVQSVFVMETIKQTDAIV